MKTSSIKLVTCCCVPGENILTQKIFLAPIGVPLGLNISWDQPCIVLCRNFADLQNIRESTSLNVVNILGEKRIRVPEVSHHADCLGHILSICMPSEGGTDLIQGSNQFFSVYSTLFTCERGGAFLILLILLHFYAIIFSSQGPDCLELIIFDIIGKKICNHPCRL